MSRFAQPTRWGATLLAPDRTLFRLWAPDAPTVALEVEGRPARPMRPEGDGWYAIETPVGAGARYRFRVSSDLAVPDPARPRP